MLANSDEFLPIKPVDLGAREMFLPHREWARFSAVKVALNISTGIEPSFSREEGESERRRVVLAQLRCCLRTTAPLSEVEQQLHRP